jgi:hypothetical protein
MPAPTPTPLPWPESDSPDATTTINLLAAMLHTELLRNKLHTPNTNQTHLHPQTIFATIGALTGYAAQCAAAASILTKPLAHQQTALQTTECPDGTRLYTGPEITQHLIPHAGGPQNLAGFLTGAVLHAGCQPRELPNPETIIKNVTETACTPALETITASPALWPIGQLLLAFWPKARAILEHRIEPPTVKKPMNIQHWPVACSIVAQQYIGMAQHVLPPPLAMRITLEAALKASMRRLIIPEASPLWARETQTIH